MCFEPRSPATLARRPRTLALARLAAGALLAACTAPRPEPAAGAPGSGVPGVVRGSPVAALFTERVQGTAVALGGGEYVTCSHVLGAGVTRVGFLGGMRDVAVVDRGAGGRWADDWVRFTLRDPAFDDGLAPIDVDFERELAEGTDIWFVGHRGDSVADTTVMLGDVEIPPERWRMPAAGVGYAWVDLETERTDDGMSGAAAIVVDPATRRPVLVGVLIGRAAITVNDLTAGYLRVFARPALPRRSAAR